MMLDKVYLVNGEYAISGEMMHWDGQPKPCVVCLKPTYWFNSENIPLCCEVCIDRFSEKYWPKC